MTDTKKRKSIWGWMSFDFASQPFHTLLVTFIFAPYFTSAVAANDTEGQAIWGFTTGAAGLLMAITAPVLGAIADTTGPKKPWIAAFSILYLIGSFTLWYAVPGLDNYTFILIAFAVGIIGVEYCTTFSNAMLPEIVDKEEVGQISGTGWALGYVGGLIALLFILLFVAENNEGTTLLGNAPMAGLDPDMREGTRAVGPITAIWFAIFMVPFFLWVPDAPKRKRTKGAVSKALRDLATSIKALPSRPTKSASSAFLLSSQARSAPISAAERTGNSVQNW